MEDFCKDCQIDIWCCEDCKHFIGDGERCSVTQGVVHAGSQPCKHLKLEGDTDNEDI